MTKISEVERYLKKLGFSLILVENESFSNCIIITARIPYEKVLYEMNRSTAPKAPVCECGASIVGGIHSSWCPLAKGSQP